MPDTQTRPDLQLGDSGIFVNWLNTTLHDLGYIQFRENWDVFDYATEHGVKSFQSEWKLIISGVVNEATWNALDCAVAGDAPPSGRNWVKYLAMSLVGLCALAVYIQERK